MVFPTIMPANSVSGFNITNSLRFNDGDTAELTRTPSSESDKQKHTISMWVKRCTSGVNQALFSAGASDQLVYLIRFIDDSLYIQQGGNFVKQTDRLFRDPSAWYHIVVAMDSTQATLNDRIKIYVNGVLETSFASSTYGGGQNLNLLVNDNVIHAVGYNTLDNATPFDGYISEFHLIDGTQLAASDFGEFNDNGVWIPKAYEGTYGTNGFYLEFKETGTGADASGMGADTSGNGNHFAVTNLAAIDVTTDTPTNNFATFNPLARSVDNTYTEGNTVYDYSGNFMRCGVTSIGVFSGKWYAEFKRTDATTIHLFGIVADNFVSDGVTVSNNSGNHNFGIEHTGTLFLKTTNDTSDIFLDGSDTGTNVDFTTTSNDIIMVAFDADSKKIWFGKNGTWSSSGDPAGGSNPSDTYDGTGSAPFFFSVGTENTQAIQGNFGNPAFAISSGNADGRGYGNFEYAVPSGFYSLCTKNLAEFG